MYHKPVVIIVDARVKTCLVALFLCLLPISGCHKAPATQSSADWDQYVASYLDAYFAVHPDLAVNAGRHEFDGKLPDFSKDANDREIFRLHSEHDRANAFD